MVKNTKGGKKGRRSKGGQESEKRELIFKEDSQEYAQVTKLLGGSRVEALCYDGITRLCGIRGKMRKRVWINQGDTVLISLRDFQDGKGDIIHKYTADEARSLITYKELPENAKIKTEENIVFENSEDEDVEFCFDEIDDI